MLFQTFVGQAPNSSEPGLGGSPTTSAPAVPSCGCGQETRALQRRTGDVIQRVKGYDDMLREAVTQGGRTVESNRSPSAATQPSWRVKEIARNGIG